MRCMTYVGLGRNLPSSHQCKSTLLDLQDLGIYLHSDTEKVHKDWLDMRNER